MSAIEYLNFDLLIETAPSDYRARVVDSPVGEAVVAFTLPFTADELRSFWGLAEGKLRHLRFVPTEHQSTASLDARCFGERLFDVVFTGDVGVCLLRSLDEAKRQHAGLCIRLRLDKDTPGLAELPWEYFYARPLNRFLVLSKATTLVRYLEVAHPPQPLGVTPPLQVLAVVANPTDVMPLAVETEWTQLTIALAGLQTQGLIKLERLERATVAALQTRLRQGDVHVLHFIGHGYFDDDANEGGLILEDDDRQSHQVDAGRLGALLHDHDPLRLVFLNTCEGARTGRTNALAGTAHQLVQQDIPAVLAMQFAVSDQAAITLSQTFYRALADGYAVDAAVAEARKALYTRGTDWEWATPVIFSRSPDNRLFVLPRRPVYQRLLVDRPLRIAIPSLLALLACLALVWSIVGNVQPPAPVQVRCPPDRQCLLVADFAPAADELAAEITRKIRAALAKPALLAPAVFAVQPVDAVTESVQARQVAGQEQALILVWGQVFRQFQELNIHFELTDLFGVGESHALRPYRVHFFDALTQQVICKEACFADLSTVREVLDQISSVIAYTAAGLLHYAAQQPEAAERDFMAALYCSGETVDLSAFPDLAPNCDPHQPIEGFNPAPIYYYAGKAKILVGDYGAAIDLLKQAAGQNSKDPAALIGIATAYRSWLSQDATSSNASQVDEALKEARQRTINLRAEMLSLHAAKRDIAAVDYELGFIAELAGDWATAQQKYREAVDSFGRTDLAAYVTLIALGRAQQMAKQFDAAEETFQAALALDDQAPWAWLELAQVYRGDRARAAEQLAQARQVAPSEAYIDIVEAKLCAEWKDYACTQAAYARALEKRPRSGWLYGLVGDFYRFLDPPNWEQAAAHYQQAAQLRPNDPWAHARLAFAYFHLGRYTESAEHYAISLNELSHPDSRKPERYCTLGQVQQAVNMLEEAVSNYRTCLDGLEDTTRRAQVEEWIAAIEAAP